MRTCTCPMQATRNGFMMTGHDALCPFHGVAPTFNERKPVIPARPKELAAEGSTKTGEIMLSCEECGTEHPPDVRCEFVDET